MYVTNASFEIAKEHEERLQRKAAHNREEIKQANGLISYEVWRREHSETVEYVFVSKWQQEGDFKAWISRESHVEEHKARHREQKANPPANEVKMKKTIRSFTVVE